MKETRVLFGTPVKGMVSHRYSNIMMEILLNPPPGHVFGHVFLAGTIVTAARDQIAAEMERGNWDKLVFWDDDMEPTIAQTHRLLSHDKDFVCGGYCKRDIHTAWHIHPAKDAEILPDGLWRMHKAALGYSVIGKNVFAAIRAKFPERQYEIREEGQKPMKLFEFFPWEIVGQNTPRQKIARLQKLFQENSKPWSASKLLEQVEQIVTADDYADNSLRGEDYAFCELAREAGVEIWLDSQLIIQHVGSCSYPISHDNLIKMTTEEWRRVHWEEMKAKRAASA